MTEHRDELCRAREAWRHAENAYHEQVIKHQAWWWAADVLPEGESTAEPITKGAWDRLSELRQAADVARDDYQGLQDPDGV